MLTDCDENIFTVSFLLLLCLFIVMPHIEEIRSEGSYVLYWSSFLVQTVYEKRSEFNERNMPYFELFL